METSKQGIELIKQFEGCKLQAYKAVPSEQYYTIGYGHYGSDVKAWDQITQQKADELLQQDLKKFEDAVNNYNSIYGWNQNEFDALVSFTFNCGKGNLNKLLDNGNRTRQTIKGKILQYNKSGGVVLTGLTRRREAELALFSKPCSSENIVESSEVTGMHEGSYKVTASALRIRSGAGTNFDIVDKVANNEILYIYDWAQVGDQLWGKINNNNWVCVRQGKTMYAVPYTASVVKDYSLKKDGNTRISENFRISEFACHDGSDLIKIDTKLVVILESIREYFNKPVYINSGYRSPNYNKKIGGATKSYHMAGKAADIHIQGVTPHEIARCAEKLGVLGIGEYTSFTHVDTREKKAFWYSSKQLHRDTFK